MKQIRLILLLLTLLVASGCTNINHNRELEHVQNFIKRNSLNYNRGVPSQPIYPRRTITSEGCLMVGNEALRKLDAIIKTESNKKIAVYSFQNNRQFYNCN